VCRPPFTRFGLAQTNVQQSGLIPGEETIVIGIPHGNINFGEDILKCALTKLFPCSALVELLQIIMCNYFCLFVEGVMRIYWTCYLPLEQVKSQTATKSQTRTQAQAQTPACHVGLGCSGSTTPWSNHASGLMLHAMLSCTNTAGYI
jgi:hypothetical protein